MKNKMIVISKKLSKLVMTSCYSNSDQSVMNELTIYIKDYSIIKIDFLAA